MYRRWFSLSAVLILLLTDTLFGLNGSVSGRYHASRLFADRFDQTLHVEEIDLGWLGLSSGIRLAESTRDLEALTYAIQLSFKPLSFVECNFLTSHSPQLWDSTSMSSVLGYVRVHAPLHPRIDFFASLGFYKRFLMLTKSTILPSWRSQYSEHDLAGEIGVISRWGNWVTLDLRAATFEALDVYNLNHPYFEAKALVGTQFEQAFFLLRYHVLLGFGRLDEWAVGVGYRIHIGSVDET